MLFIEQLLIRTSNAVDYSALKYLSTTLGKESRMDGWSVLYCILYHSHPTVDHNMAEVVKIRNRLLETNVEQNVSFCLSNEHVSTLLIKKEVIIIHFSAKPSVIHAQIFTYRTALITKTDHPPPSKLSLWPKTKYVSPILRTHITDSKLPAGAAPGNLKKRIYWVERCYYWAECNIYSKLTKNSVTFQELSKEISLPTKPL